jgi:hypothetical protein
MSQYKIVTNNVVYEKQVLHSFQIKTPARLLQYHDDANLQLEEWYKSDVGQWVQRHCKNVTKEEYKSYDPVTDRIVYCIKIMGYCTAEHWTYFILRWS